MTGSWRSSYNDEPVNVSRTIVFGHEHQEYRLDHMVIDGIHASAEEKKFEEVAHTGSLLTGTGTLKLR